MKDQQKAQIRRGPRIAASLLRFVSSAVADALHCFVAICRCSGFSGPTMTSVWMMMAKPHSAGDPLKTCSFTRHGEPYGCELTVTWMSGVICRFFANNMRFIARMSQLEQKQAVNCMMLVEHKQGERVTHKGEEGRQVFIVLSGIVKESTKADEVRSTRGWGHTASVAIPYPPAAG